MGLLSLEFEAEPTSTFSLQFPLQLNVEADVDNQAREGVAANAADIALLRPEVDVLVDKSVDMDVTREPGPFATIPNANVAGIAGIVSSTPDQIVAVNRGTFDFDTLAFGTSVALPDNGDDVLVVVRLNEVERGFITSYREGNPAAPSFSAVQSRFLTHDDGAWAYYIGGTRSSFAPDHLSLIHI